MVLFEQEKAQEALEHLRKAVEMAPESPDSHTKLGTVLAKAGRLNDAVAELQKAVELQPDSVEFRFNLGFVLGLRGDFAGAVVPLREAVRLSGGKDWRSLMALADACYRSGNREEAIESVRAALKIAEASHDAQLERNLRATLEQYERGAAK
jgi:Flp pilus assembly protein TadD